jgi:hypothetical protein
VLVEMTSLLEKEVITPRLGGSTDMLFDLWKIIFQFRKMVQDGKFLSSSESGSRFLTDMNFPVQKMVQIIQSFS